MKRLSQKSKKRLLQITALALMLVLTMTPLLNRGLSTGASAAMLKEEVIYVRLQNNGRVDQVYVVNSFELDGEKNIVDYGNYSHVRNLSGTDTLKLEDGSVTITPEGDRLYYEGYMIEPELPWLFSIKYLLDGNEMTADEIAGKSGRLTMLIKTSANPKGNQEFFDTYCLQISVSLDSDSCRNLEAEGGTVAVAGSSRQVSYVVLPGKETSLELKADVTDFEMPAMTIAGVTMGMDFDFDDVDMSDISELTDGLIELDDGVAELLDGIFELRDGVRELHDGTAELNDGVAELSDGVVEMADGVGELADGTLELKDGVGDMTVGVIDLVGGVEELDDGVGELKDGVGDFRDGISELVDGTEELYDGIVEIAGGSGDINIGLQRAAAGGPALYDGFSEFFYGIIEMVNAQLPEYMQVTAWNYADVLGGAIAAADAEAAAYLEAVEPKVRAEEPQIFAKLLKQMQISEEDYEFLPEEQKAVIAATVESIIQEQIAAIKQEIIDKLDESTAQLAGLLQMLDGYEQLLDGLYDYTGGISQISGGFGEFHDGLREYRDGVGEYLDGIYELYDGADELYDGVAELKDGTFKLLDGVIELRDGVIELYDGIVELHDGVIELQDGVLELKDGVIELKDGVYELHDGVGDLVDGVDELYDGVAELKDGTAEIVENTEDLDEQIVDGIKDEVAKMMGGDEPVYSFVSQRNGEVEAVQFVMQTEGITIPAPVEAEPEPEPAPTFWQRLLKLFGIEY